MIESRIYVSRIDGVALLEITDLMAARFRHRTTTPAGSHTGIIPRSGVAGHCTAPALPDGRAVPTGISGTLRALPRLEVEHSRADVVPSQLVPEDNVTDRIRNDAGGRTT
jgi:hypothetical protein